MIPLILGAVGAVGAVTAAAAVSVANKLTLHKLRKEEREVLEMILMYKIKEHSQNLKKKMKDLQEDFTKWKKSTEYELQSLSKENQGKEEEECVWDLKFMFKKKIQKLSQRFETLAEELQDWPVNTVHQYNDLRAELKQKKGRNEWEIASVLEHRLNEKIWEMNHKIQTLEEDVKDCLETTNHKFKVLKAELKQRNQGKKEVDIALALLFLLKEKVQELCERVEILEKYFLEGLETIKHEVQDIRGELEKNQGKKEENIALALLFLLKKEDWQLYQGVETLEKDFLEGLETIKLEVQDIRRELDMNQGKKGDIARTLEYKMSEKILKLLQKTQTLEEDVKDYLETIGHKLKVLKAELNE